MFDLINKLVSNKGNCNMTLYCNLKMELTTFEYNNNTYIIDDYIMKEDCYIITSNQAQYKIPVDLILHKEESRIQKEVKPEVEIKTNVEINVETTVKIEFTDLPETKDLTKIIDIKDLD